MYKLFYSYFVEITPIFLAFEQAQVWVTQAQVGKPRGKVLPAGSFCSPSAPVDDSFLPRAPRVCDSKMSQATAG